jgi:hypothetical protein
MEGFHRVVARAKKARFFVLLWFTYAYFYQGSDPGQLSRVFLTQGIVERGGIDITPYHGFTIDKAEFGGTFFCDKAPGLSVLAAPLFALEDLADRLGGFSSDALAMRRVRLHMLVIFACGLSGVVAAIALARVLQKLGATAAQGRLLVAGYALGTLAMPYSTAFYAHQVVAALLIGSFALIVREEPAALAAPRRLVGLGLLWGLAITSEYPSALLVAPLGLYLLAEAREPPVRRRMFALVALGAAFPLVLHALYVWRAFGSPLVFPYKYNFEPFFRQHHDEGFMGISLPSPAGILGITVSRYRGLFFFCPFLLLSFFGVARWLRSGVDKRELLLVVSMLAIYFFFSASYYAWDGGGSTGPRHLVPVLPFLVIAILPFLRSGGALAHRICQALVVVSIVCMLVCAATLLHQAEGEVLLSNPLYSSVLPAFARHELGLNTQDVRELGPRADASYTLGVLVGLGPWTSLAALAALWGLAYAPSWLSTLRRRRGALST